MAKAALALVSVLCLLALAGPAHCHDDKGAFHVQGKVYCDTCRVLFPTRLSEYLAGAEVELKCRHLENKTETLSVTGRTNKDGHYKLAVEGDHDDEMCEVNVISSPNPECNEHNSEISSAIVSLAKNSGIRSDSRFCNPIGFRKKTALPNCAEVFDELGFVPFSH
ncbi:anther-specific protein LAT52-like [Diospyros lotus]|uniref:anther-specific protein LAT52-like n=1 Tax=Diospyros lotus TaxID=55363 RepID=UPI00224D7209|nr:anther-specific protein LAT52-like [Diospyros lotus]